MSVSFLLKLFMVNKGKCLIYKPVRLYYLTVYKGRYVVEVLYNGRHVTGSPFHQEIFDPRKVKLESARMTGVVGDEMSLDGIVWTSLSERRGAVILKNGTTEA